MLNYLNTIYNKFLSEHFMINCKDSNEKMLQKELNNFRKIILEKTKINCNDK